MADSTNIPGGSPADQRYHFAQPWWDDRGAGAEGDLTALPSSAAQPELVIRAERVSATY